MTSGFRVQTVSIEGFKGFTERRVIDFKGRHAFLLGQNGNGKSSIIEAIRWGLFGSTGRPNEIVANRGYPSRCRVELTLLRDGKRWNLRRSLIRGVSGGSDAELTDESGQEHAIREVLPQLDSLDAGEGTHIIFAPQSVPLRRQPEDLSPFERTVFNHLGLTHPRALLSEVTAFTEGQTLTEHGLGVKLTECRDQIDRQIGDLEKQRNSLSASSPWPGDQVPTTADSENRARELIKDITGKRADDSLSGVSLDGLLSVAVEALQGRQERDQGKLQSELSEIEKHLAALNTLCCIQEDIETKMSEIIQIQNTLSAKLRGISLDDLSKMVSEERTIVDTDALRLRVIENAISLLRRTQDTSVSCPVCSAEHIRSELDSQLERNAAAQSGDRASRLRELDDQYTEATELQHRVDDLQRQLVELEGKANRSRISIDSEMESSQTGTSVQLKSLIETLKRRRTSIRAQIENQQNWINASQARLSKLDDEGKFHQLHRSVLRLRQSRNRFELVEKAYGDLVAFNESVKTIGRTIESCLTGQIEESTPGVSDDLTKAFAALTRHPWYDRLVIDNTKLPKLELLVASTQDPLAIGHPTGVLNGQAESALELVPHFAFGQSSDAPTEVYLVLLDDPTRAFDEEHIEILMERLADLGSSVQLIVASQETSRFQALLPKNFKRASYVVIEPRKWSYRDGPALSIEY